MIKKIIIVEDDKDLLDSLGFLLRAEGHKVWKFERAGPVYKKINFLVPDTIIVDIKLPDGRGDALAGFVKRDKELKDTKVILISAGEDVARLAITSKADLYLKKPFSFDQLLSLV